MERLLPALAALVCALAAAAWTRSTIRRHQVATRLAGEQIDPDLWHLAQNDYRRDLQTAIFTALASLALLVVAVVGIGFWPSVLVSLLGVPAAIALVNRESQVEIARISANRAEIEKKAREVLTQEELAPLQWAARLAPSQLPRLPNFEIGQAYQPGSGAMAGDFYDVFKIDDVRVGAVIGDVTGHGIEPSITALQAKYLLRAFLIQFRDPGQALEQLNAQMSVLERGEEFISLCVMVFDTEAQTLRFASAGHPAAFVWHGGEVRPLGATGPLLMLDPTAPYHSREMSWDVDDVAVMYTDGLAEA
ncbi:MAG: SpoIIE family protein phosphatase, partial [Acidimicrobiia bacterium]|nr:SpoIIE family protein phosphatase [Acidimicrobiia bacterium]